MCFLSFGIDRNSYSDEVNVTEVKSYIKSIKKVGTLAAKF